MPKLLTVNIKLDDDVDCDIFIDWLSGELFSEQMYCGAQHSSVMSHVVTNLTENDNVESS